MIINYDSSIVKKFGASLTDDTRVIIYDRHMFFVKATGWKKLTKREFVNLFLLKKASNYFRSNAFCKVKFDKPSLRAKNKHGE
jgi:hypothetical protein